MPKSKLKDIPKEVEAYIDTLPLSEEQRKGLEDVLTRFARYCNAESIETCIIGLRSFRQTSIAIPAAASTGDDFDEGATYALGIALRSIEFSFEDIYGDLFKDA